MTARTKALFAWCDAVIHHITDLTKIRAARASFEALAGQPATGETCGEYVRVITEQGPQITDRPAAPVLPRRGTHRFERPVNDAPQKKKDPAKVELGRRVRAARLQAGYETQVRLASVAQIPVSSVNTIEAGFTRPAVKTLSKLAGVLGVSVEWLRTGVGQPSMRVA